ncbi:hypothetical protein EO238_01535 [Citrobacter sp. AAK_AS5]|nr:hypothetical protein F0326_03545 [Citrobacter portucalensis]RXM26397.1 hypothetical protein EO238_01535 [Citrobacter sp. AAK_AS5]
MKPPVVLSFTASLVKLYPIYQGELPYNKLQGYTRHTSSCMCVSCVTRPIPGPRPCGVAVSSAQICSRQICRSPQSHS